jgi:hypothetical protein
MATRPRVAAAASAALPVPVLGNRIVGADQGRALP